MGARRYTVEELYEACRWAYKSEVICSEPLAEARRNVAERLASSLGLEIEPGLPRRIRIEFGDYQRISGDGEVLHGERFVRAGREAERRYNAVSEVLERIAAPEGFVGHRDETLGEVLSILREGGRS